MRERGGLTNAATRRPPLHGNCSKSTATTRRGKSDSAIEIRAA